MPNGRWFVFDAQSGCTLAKGFASKVGAVVWMAREAEKIRCAAQGASK